MDDFTTVFEIAGGNTALPWLDRLTYLVVGIGGLTGGILLLVLRAALHGRLRVRLFPAIFLMVWGVGWLSFAPTLLAVYGEADDLYADYQNHRYETIEGMVEVLREQPESGHAPGDLIRVGDREFEVNYFRMTPAYHRTIARGGALRSGVYARLCYQDADILRVDIKRQE